MIDRRTLGLQLKLMGVLVRPFPSDEAASKLLYLALRNVTARRKKAAREWKAALSQFAILFEDRFAAVGM